MPEGQSDDAPEQVATDSGQTDSTMVSAALPMSLSAELSGTGDLTLTDEPERLTRPHNEAAEPAVDSNRPAIGAQTDSGKNLRR